MFDEWLEFNSHYANLQYHCLVFTGELTRIDTFSSVLGSHNNTVVATDFYRSNIPILTNS